MLTLLAYARYVRAPSVGRYLSVALLFALGLMSKPMLVTLPFVLLLLPVWMLVRMALNALDGMMAREMEMATAAGAVLNEVGDVLSDLVLYVPLAWYDSGARTAVLALRQSR